MRDHLRIIEEQPLVDGSTDDEPQETHVVEESEEESSESMYDSTAERMAVSSCDEGDLQYPEFIVQ